MRFQKLLIFFVHLGSLAVYNFASDLRSYNSQEDELTTSHVNVDLEDRDHNIYGFSGDIESIETNQTGDTIICISFFLCGFQSSRKFLIYCS